MYCSDSRTIIFSSFSFKIFMPCACFFKFVNIVFIFFMV